MRERGPEGKVRERRERSGLRGVAREAQGDEGEAAEAGGGGACARARRPRARCPPGERSVMTGRWAWWAATVPGRPGKAQVRFLSFYSLTVFYFF